MKKIIFTTTIPLSLNFFKGQLAFLSNYFDVMAISSEKDKLEIFGREEAIKTLCVPMKRPISLINDIVSLFHFAIIFIKLRPDIVHGNTPKASFLSMVASWFTFVPVRIYMCHGLRYQGYTGMMRNLLKIMERISCKCATEVLCVSNGVRETLIADRICHASKAKVVLNGSSNGIDITYFSRKSIERNVDKIPTKNFTFCFVGRIVKDKGINELILAFKRLNKIYLDINLLIVGPIETEQNPIDKEIMEEIRINKNIYSVGSQNDVRQYMVDSQVFVLPSYREGFGVVLMEAGALGLPCITTNIIGCNEIIQDGVNGKIIPPKDENALFEVMKWFYEHRNDEVKEMAERARGMIVERYERSMVWNAFLKEYQSLCKYSN